MRRFIISTIALASIATAGAYDYPYLTFQTTDGTTKSVAVESLTITVANGQLVAQNADGSETFTVAQLAKMFFAQTADATGIGSIGTDGTTAVEVYTIGGMAIGKFDSMSQARTALKPGLYIVRSGNKTTKISIK